MPAFEPSKYQSDVFDAVKNTNDSLAIQAVAGSGKTTTIIAALDYLPRNKKTIMLAFNKSIATELSTKVPRGVESKTCHSVGFAAWRRYLGRGKRCRVAQNKSWDILNQMRRDGDLDKQEVSRYGAFVVRLVGLAKNAGMGTDLCEDTPENWAALVEHHNLTLPSVHAKMHEAIDISGRVLRRSQSDKLSIDFDDMLYMPVFYGATFDRYDVIFIDEVQDTNVLQAAMMESMLSVKGRVILVGDIRQAIYGFRGADAAAFGRLIEDFDCKVLPLSVSYRCAKAIVAEAQRIAPEIEPFDGAAEGTVDSLMEYDADTFTHHDAILCRNTAPLVSMAYGFIGRGVAIQFLGRDIGKGLINLINRLDAGSIDTLEYNLDVWERRESEKAREKHRESLLQSIEDRAACIRVFIRNLSETKRTIPHLIAAIEDLFAERKGQMLTLCTVHKSKGMEWPRVFILDRGLMPSKWATMEWQREQESNLQYVAITRAKKHLTYINSDNWKKGK